MNFSFMIILLLALLFYISLKVKFNKYLIILLLISLLIIYEIYNYNEIKQETFYQYSVVVDPDDKIFKEKYDFNENLDPYLISRKEFNMFNIPHEAEKDTKYGMPCQVQKEVHKYIQKSNKLNEQKAHVNLLYKYKPFSEKSIDDKVMDLSVFNPVKEEDISKIECPTVCHLIDHKYPEAREKLCKSEKYIPYMKTKQDYIEKLKTKVNSCKFKRSEGSCISNKQCSWDKDYGKCSYDRRGCLYQKNSLNYSKSDDDKEDLYKPPECYTRCEFLDIPDKEDLSKFNCESAVLYIDDDVTPQRYCQWDKRTRKCKPICSFYDAVENGGRVCISDENCKTEVSGGTTKCVNK